ncbi:MAG: glycosyltransferase, partial [Candidatus Micrarchaeia archaeon]
SGKVPDFEAELSNANIYISNSYHEGFNMPLIEAEAHSMPVLARRGTAMDELVKDGYNGYLFDSVDELPKLINKIMLNYKQMSYNAWKHSQNYNYEKFKERYLKIIKEYEDKKK